MPKQARRPDKYPFDCSNRASVIFDGDNVRTGLKNYGFLPPLDDLLDWIIDPESLGIDRLVSACLFLTVPHFNSVDHRLRPIKNRSRFCEHLLITPEGTRGYPDNEMYCEAIRLAPFTDTVVLVSSDGGVEGGIYQFAAELRKGFNRFTKKYDEQLKCEVVCVSSHLLANANWRALAVNSVAIEDIFPSLKPRLIKLRPFSALSAQATA